MILQYIHSDFKQSISTCTYVHIICTSLRHQGWAESTCAPDGHKSTQDPGHCKDDVLNNRYRTSLCLQWVAPDTVLSEFTRAGGGLAPPQVYEICRLLHFPKLGDLHRFAWERASTHRVKEYFPVVVGCEDGLMVVYPGQHSLWILYFFVL